MDQRYSYHKNFISLLLKLHKSAKWYKNAPVRRAGLRITFWQNLRTHDQGLADVKKHSNVTTDTRWTVSARLLLL